MTVNLTPPTALRGDESAKISQMHSFLFRLTEQLNAALVETENRIDEAKTEAMDIGASGEVTETEKQVASLKSLIVKTADTVRSEMDVLETQLRSEYIAKSEWGTYRENISTEIRQTAESTVESYHYQAQIDDIAEDAAAFDRFMAESNGYIRRGIIGYDDGGMPIIGIAIGQDLKSTTVTIDGEVYAEIDMSRSLATYTSNRVTFWQNGAEVAWFSNAELNVTRISVADAVNIGDWQLSKANGFTLKWTGGA